MMGLHIIIIVFVILDILLISQGEDGNFCADGFIERNNGSELCRNCTKCPVGAEVKEVCTNQSDTVCRSCDLGTFSSDGFKCQNCSHCPPGTYVAQYCSLTSDTKCEPCAKDFYSSGWSLHSCRPCSRCSRLKTVLKNCSKSENYQCGDCIRGYFKHPNLPACMRCSYCYPERPNVTFVVPECRSKSDDPNYMCMPVAVNIPVKFAGSANAEIQESDGSSVTSKTLQFVSTPYNDVLIPPMISVSIIITGVLICLCAVIIIVMRRRLRSKKCRENETQLSLNATRSGNTIVSEGPLSGEQTTSLNEENAMSILLCNHGQTKLDEHLCVPCESKSHGLNVKQPHDTMCSYYAENEAFEDEDADPPTGCVRTISALQTLLRPIPDTESRDDCRNSTRIAFTSETPTGFLTGDVLPIGSPAVPSMSTSEEKRNIVSGEDSVPELSNSESESQAENSLEDSQGSDSSSHGIKVKVALSESGEALARGDNPPRQAARRKRRRSRRQTEGNMVGFGSQTESAKQICSQIGTFSV